MLVYSSDIYLLCHKFTINYTMKFIACNTSDFCLEILLVRVATIIELGNHEIFNISILKFDILINSHIVYSNIWSPYWVKVRMSVAILSHISGNVGSKLTAFYNNGYHFTKNKTLLRTFYLKMSKFKLEFCSSFTVVGFTPPHPLSLRLC